MPVFGPGGPYSMERGVPFNESVSLCTRIIFPSITSHYEEGIQATGRCLSLVSER
jgi:hypothetical protein